MRPKWPRAVFAVAFAAALSACGGADDGGAATQPAPAVTTFEQGQFDNLPLYPRSDPFGARSEKDGVVARSYRATGVTPTGIIEFYAEALPTEGWTEVKPAYRTDTASRADWVNDDWRLEISSTRIEDRRNPTSTDVVVQYSLVLRPR